MPTTAIAISGGIDSLAAAHLLKQQGHRLIGIHFLSGYEGTEARRMKRIAAQLDIPIEIIDCQDDFKAHVVDYFTRTYLNGCTPNPCLVCNPMIKFGVILNAARRYGALRLATGHYARIKKDDEGRYHLLKGVDPLKDQSYFLAFLTQKQLAGACFPLGSMHKSDVRRLTDQNRLLAVSESESQDICFIKGKHYSDFLMQQAGLTPRPGRIEDVNGNIIGNHDGLHRFTIGQRRGINCPAAEPYYVVGIDMQRNRLVVGFKKDVYRKECRISGINWICMPPDSPLRVKTRVRYGHKEVDATLIPTGCHTALIRFDAPQAAVTPGQGAVFYQDEEVIGGGWIDR